MKVSRTVDELRQALMGQDDIGFVPTMGAFHDGHLELMRTAGRECRDVVVSLFVNPTQFGPNEDLSKYPRQEEADFAAAEAVGVRHMFAPTAEEMYGASTTMVRAGSAAEGWEGSVRPGHFDGVATIVLKLFQIVKPRVAYFGLKDLQQCAVIRQMVTDLYLPVDLRWVEVVREPSGLAMSSRNAYLSADERRDAAALPTVLRESAARLFAEGEDFGAVVSGARASLEGRGFAVDYLAYVDSRDMSEIADWRPTGRLMAAARFGPIRLLDNMPVDPPVSPSP